MRAALVIWKDVVYQPGWNTIEEVEQMRANDDFALVHQVGFVYHENSESLTLVDSYFVDGSKFGTIHKIPKRLVVSVKYLNDE